MIASLTVIRSLLCYYRLEPPRTCTTQARPNLGNLQVYSSLGLLLILIVMRLDRLVSILPFTLLLALMVWNSVVPDSHPVAEWSSVVFYVGAFAFGLLVSLLQERNERYVFQSGEQLEIEIAERKAAERDALAAQQDRDKHINYIFHEIRVPLNTVVQSLNLMETDKELQAAASQDTLESMSRMQSGLGSMETIINDTLDFRRISEGRFSFTLRPIDYHELVRETMFPFEPLWKDKGITFTLALDKRIDAIPFKVLADPDRVKQVLWNLVSNAIKFTPSRGAISVSTALTKETARIIVILTEVSDTGIGISTEDQKRVFTDFVQIDPVHAQGGKGSGLGLAICKAIVKALNGEYGVRSVLGQGSTFFFSIPFELASESKQPRTPREPVIGPVCGENDKQPQGGSVSGLRILVTDDDAMTRTVTSKLLNRLGHVCDTAVNGLDCLEKMAKTRYDVLFIDNHMPLLNGQETIKRIRGSGNSVPIISLTGSSDLETRNHLLELGATEVLVKPSSMGTIEKVLRRITG